MKTLNSYINEKRETLTKLPFEPELFCNFVNDAIVGAEYDDSDYWKPMEDIIVKEYGKGIWRWFYGWCESYLELKKQGVSVFEFYGMIFKIPLDRIKRVIGAGSNGIVLDIDEDKVIKIFFGDHIKNCDKPFIDWCYTHNSKVFPKVYKIGKNWVVLEKLKTGTPNIEKLFKLIDHTNIQGKSIYDWIKEKDVDLSIFNKEELEAYNWCITCKKEMEDMHSPMIGWPGDLVQHNVGERKNGDIVFFDI